MLLKRLWLLHWLLRVHLIGNIGVLQGVTRRLYQDPLVLLVRELVRAEVLLSELVRGGRLRGHAELGGRRGGAGNARG